MNSLLTVDDLADYLSVPKSWVQRKVSNNEIPYVKIGRYVRFTEENVNEIVQLGESRPPDRMRVRSKI